MDGGCHAKNGLSRIFGQNSLPGVVCRQRPPLSKGVDGVPQKGLLVPG